MKLPFKTTKLGKYIKRINTRVKDDSSLSKDLTVYGVSNKAGVVVTGKDASDDLSNYIVVNENTFAYNPYRVNVGSLGLTPTGFKGVVSPAYVVFKIKDGLVAEFLFNYLKSDVGINLIRWYGDKGGVRSALRYKDLENIDIPDLDIKQQEKFIDKLKKINGALAVMDDKRVKICDHVNLLRQVILQEAVQGKLAEQDPKDEPATELLKKIKAEKEKLIKEKKIKKEKLLLPITDDEIPYELPKGWAWCRLQDITSLVTDGKHGDCRNESDSGYYFLSAKDIQNEKLVYANARQITFKDFSEVHRRTNLKSGDICMVNTGATVGKMAVAPNAPHTSKTTFQKSVAVIKTIRKFIMVEYIAILLKAATTNLLKVSGGSAINNLLLGDLKAYLSSLPPLAEQKRIVEKVDGLMKYCDELEVKIKQSKSDSEKLMQAVLQEAFNN